MEMNIHFYCWRFNPALCSTLYSSMKGLMFELHRVQFQFWVPVSYVIMFHISTS